jgi:hypothetical protein
MFRAAVATFLSLCRWLTANRRRQIAVYAAVALLFVLTRLGVEPYDDAHFFERIAENALDHATLAWNLDEGPVYGATSQSFQLVSVALSAITRSYTVLATRILSIACLVAAFSILLGLTARHDKGASATFALCSAVLLFPSITGMETALAILASALVLRSRESASWLARPVALTFLYVTRPDAALLGLVVLAERWWSTKAWREVALAVLGLAAVLLLCKLYYGTALPLPFYAKQKAFTPYDAEFLRLSAEIGLQRFAAFALVAAPLFLRASFLRDRRNLELLGATFAFVAYHLASTVDVMGMQGRFYAPCLPLLVLASARAREASARRAFAAASAFVSLFVIVRLAAPLLFDRSGSDAIPVVLQATTLIGGLALVLTLSRPRWQRVLSGGLLATLGVALALSLNWRDLRFRSDDDYLGLQTQRSTVYRGLDTLRSCFGEQIHVYHSEIGLPGLRFQRGKVTDLVGLMSPEWLFRKQTFDQLCRRDRPEAIFFPHRNYAGLNAEIRVSDCLKGYRRVVSESSSPLYVRADLAPRYLECAREREDEFVVGSWR